MFSRKQLVQLMAPLIVEQILAVLVGMVDVMMVAAVGEAAVSGVSLVDSISMLIIQLLAALATGGAVVASQFIGRKDERAASEAAGQLVAVTLLISVAIMAVALIGSKSLLRLIFGAIDSDVMRNAEIYFAISAVSYPFLAIYNACAALYRSMGNSKVSMKTSICMNLINVAGNAICIFGLHMGVEGVAIPTLLSRAFAAVVMIVLIRRPGNVIAVRNMQDLKLKPAMIKRILAIGIPNGLENSMFQFGKIMVQSLVSSLGTVAIAGFAVASNIVTLEYLPGNAISLGLITVVGQCVGAGEYEQAEKYTKLFIRINYGILAVLATSIGVFSRQIVGIYSLSAQAAQTAALLITAHSICMVIWPPAFTLPSVLRASSDVKFTMLTSVCSMWLFRIGFSYLFIRGFHMDVIGVWLAMFVDWAFRGLMFTVRFKQGKWKRMKIC